MNLRYHNEKPKTKQSARKKAFKRVNDSPSPIKWKFIEEEEEVKLLTKWDKVKKWFLELPIWSIR